MAEQTQTGSGDLQRLVRTIVVDLMSQEQNSPVQTAASNTGNRFGSVDEELNNSLRIPRGIPHENMPSTSSNLNTAPNVQGSIAMNFNSRQNYARNQPQRKRQIGKQPATLSRKRIRTQSSDAINKCKIHEERVPFAKPHVVNCAEEGKEGVSTDAKSCCRRVSYRQTVEFGRT